MSKTPLIPVPRTYVATTRAKAAILATAALSILCSFSPAQASESKDGAQNGEASPATTLPVRHHKPTTWADWEDCTRGLTGKVAGERLRVKGYETRPTVLQRAATTESPLVVMLHGANGCIEKLQSQTDIEELATAWGVSLLWVSGAQLGGRWWNVNGRCCGKSADGQVDDYAYIRAALKSVRSMGLNPRRVVVVGKSNGGGMAVGVGCALRGEVDVVVSASGFKGSSCRGTGVSLMAIGGTEDKKLGAVEATKIANFWRNGPLSCSPKPKRELRKTAAISTWKCKDGRFVRLAVIKGMEHLWPTYSHFSADEEVLRIARGELP